MADIIPATLCIHPGSREAIEHLLDDKLQDKTLSKMQVDTVLELKEEIGEIKDCEPEPKKGNTKKEKSTRKPSEYNIFIGECLRGEVPAVKFNEGDKQPQKMKACAVEWNEKKKKKG